jgi:hypothetical protein
MTVNANNINHVLNITTRLILTVKLKIKKC